MEHRSFFGKWKVWVVLLAIPLFTQCGISSFYPLVKEGDGSDIPELVGTWKSEDGQMQQSTWNISHLSDQHYRLEYIEKKKGNRIFCNLMASKFGNVTWLDIKPDLDLTSERTNNKVQNSLLVNSLVVGHIFVRVKMVDNNELQIAELSEDEVREMNQLLRKSGSSDTLRLLKNQQSTLLISETALIRKGVRLYSEAKPIPASKYLVLKRDK